MKRIRNLTYIVLLLPFLVFAQDEGARGSISKKVDKANVKGEKRALVVGVSEYQSKDLNLNYADDDAFLFKQYLTKVDSVPEKNITYLVNKDATSFNILTALDDLINTSQEGDIVYLFFAGHGDVVDKDNVENKIGFLLAHDTNQDREFYGTQGVVPFEDVNKTVNEIANKKARIILILDACKSGYLYLNGSQKNLEAANNTFENATKFLSCKPNELSYESTDAETLSQGFFTYYLVLGFMGAADSMIQDFNLHYFELEMFLKNNLASATNNKQTPVIDTKASTEVFKKVTSKDKSDALKQVQDQQKLSLLLANRNSEANTDIIYNADNTIVNQFNDAIKKQNYYGNSNSALTLLKSAKKDNSVSKDVLKRMKNIIVNSLSTDAQLLVNSYIGNAEVLPPSSEFTSKANHLSICLDLLEKDHFSYNRILTSKLFLEAYAIIRARNFSKYPEAKQKLNEALKLEDRAAYIHNALGVVLNHENKFKDSEHHYRRANQLIPTWSFPLNNLGTNYHDQYRYNEGKTYLKEALKLQGSYATALNNLGAISESQGKYTEAEMYYHRVGESEGGFIVTTLRNLGNLYEKKGNIKKALDYYEQALNKNPKAVYTYYNFSELLIDESIDIKRAESMLKKAIELEPFFSRGHAEYADFLRRFPKNDDSYKEALDLYDFAINNDPFYEWAYAGRGWLYHKQDLKEEALASFNTSLEVNGNKPKPYHYLANYYKYGLKDYTKAEEYYKKAIEKDTFYLPAYEELVDLYNKNNQEEKSLEVLTKLVTWNSDAPDIWNLLGNTYFDLGDFTNAVTTYKKSIQIDSTYAKGFTNLAYSLMKTGKHKEAANTYKKAVLYNPFKNNLESFASLLLTEARKKNRNNNTTEAKEILSEAYALIQNYETTFALAEFNYFNDNANEANRIANTIKVEELSKTRKLKYLELLTKISVDLKLRAESNNYFMQLKAINPRPNHVLEALVKLTNKDKKGAIETLAKTNALMLRDKFLVKKYSENTIKKIKQLQQ